ncbi:MAG: nitroreductase [Firmicutes bacterium]|nr:nitroreductase [Bacillota bacterium]
MDLELLKARHSVRQYTAMKIPQDVRDQLDEYVREINEASGMSIQIVYDEPECFNTRIAHYGRFENANNYIAIVGTKAPDLDEKGGYYGEKIVLKAQELGLNTCWAAMGKGRGKEKIGPDEKEVIVISLGYGRTQGSARRSKKPESVSNLNADSPEWFRSGVEAALLAPTAINQQRFYLELDGQTVKARIPKIGVWLKVDLGIVKCHFELGAGDAEFTWA